jgi:kynurenine 3-monooxygenase
MEKVVIVGGGLVGSLTAILMAKKGLNVEVYENRDDIREAQFIGGKSINLACSNRGWAALEAADIAKEIMGVSIPMYGRRMHPVEGEMTYQSYGKEEEAIFSVSRGDLNKRLILKADTFENVTFFFNHKCLDVNLKTNELVFENTHSGEKKSVIADRIIATDGAFSAVRNRLMRTNRFNYCQSYLEHGYKEILLPANEDGTHKLEKNALHIWPRGSYMLIALPNFDGSYTCTLFFPFEGPTSFESLKTKEDVDHFFQEVFPDFYALIPDVAEEYFSNPDAALVTVKCAPWNYEDKIILMGDAAHAIVPFYGQGMNAGFEDARILSEMYDQKKGNWSEIIPEFAALRKPDGDAIADLAIQNFIEMRDLVADEMFLLRKKIENRFFAKYPDKWMPLYSQVTFSHIRYSEALKTGKEQWAIMDRIMQKPNIHEIWDSEEVEHEILAAVHS